MEKDSPGVINKTVVDTSLMPMYGGFERASAQKKADKQLLQNVDEGLRLCGGIKLDASNDFVQLGWEFVAKRDYDTAIKRFNQSWLVDKNNPNT